MHVLPSLGLALTQLVSLLKGDLVPTHDEVVGLLAGLLRFEAAPTGTTGLSDGSKTTWAVSRGGMCPNWGATSGCPGRAQRR